LHRQTHICWGFDSNYCHVDPGVSMGGRFLARCHKKEAHFAGAHNTKYVLHVLMHIFKYRSCEIDPQIFDFWYRICGVATSRGGRQFVTPSRRAVAWQYSQIQRCHIRYPPAHVHTYILPQRLRDGDFDRSEIRRHVCRRLTGIFKVADAEGPWYGCVVEEGANEEMF